MALYDINLSQSNLSRHIEDLNNKILQLQTLIGDYKIKKNEINDFWDDADANAYIETINHNITVCENALRDVETARDNLTGTLQNVVTMNTNVKGYIQKASDAVANLLVE